MVGSQELVKLNDADVIGCQASVSFFVVKGHQQPRIGRKKWLFSMKIMASK
jgi:hypothetical protein